MRHFNSATARVFVYEGEDADEYAQMMRWFAALDMDKEKVALQSKTAKGFGEKPIIILSFQLSKQRHVRAFTEALRERLGVQFAQLRQQADSRLDEDNNFFLRFIKKFALNKELVLTDKGDCVHLTLSVAAFPATKENAVASLQAFLNQKD